MYSQGNYDIMFGQNSDRLLKLHPPPQLSGHPVQPIQQGTLVPPPPLLIQPTRPPNGYSAPKPTTLPHLSNSIQISGQPLSNEPLAFHGGTHMAPPYLRGQQNLQHLSHWSGQNAQYIPPLPAPTAPTATVAPAAPTSSHFFNSFPHAHPSSVQSLPSCPSSSSEALNLPSPPPRPNDSKVIRNIEVLCSFITKNGVAFEDMACQKEAGNPEFSFLFAGGEPGSEAAIAREYYLWMRKKSCLHYDLLKGKIAGNFDTLQTELQSSRPTYNSEGALHSLSDSDMEMEDDITCPDIGLSVGSNPVNSLSEEADPVGNAVELQKQGSAQKNSGDTIEKLNIRSNTNLADDDIRIPGNPSVQINVSHEPFRLVEEFASDDTSKHGNEAYVSVFRPTSPSHPKKHGVMASDYLTFQNSDSRATCSNLLKSDQMVPESMALGNEGETTAAGTKASDTNSCKAFEESETLVNADAGDLSGGSRLEKEHVNSSLPLKVDEFGRMVREGVSDTDSDDSHSTRRHGRRHRIRNRSPSQSPVDKRKFSVDKRKRRRSPSRRNRSRRSERRSRSRSWSPWRNRSRSPLRHTGDFRNENVREGKSHMPQCFNCVKGRCYGGASCRYMRNDQNKDEGFRQSKSRQHPPEVGDGSRANFHEQDHMRPRFSSAHDGLRGGEIDLHQGGPSCGNFASTGAVDDEKERAEPMNCAALPSLSGQHGEAPVAVENKNATLKEFSPLRKSDSNANSDLATFKRNGSEDQKVIRYERGESAQLHQGFDNHDLSQQLDPSVSGSTFLAASVPSLPRPQAEAQLSKKRDEFVSQKDVLASDSFTANHSYHVSKPSPFPPPPWQGASDPAIWDNLQTQQPFPSYPNPCKPGAQGQLQRSEMTARKDSVNSTFPRLNASDHFFQSQTGLSQSRAFSDYHRIEDFGNTVFHSSDLLSKQTDLPTSLLPSSSYSQESRPQGPVTLQNLTYLPNQSSTYGPRQTASTTISSKTEGSLSLPRYSSESLPMNNSFSSDLGFRITPHHNPYASTFDQPLSSKFSSISHKETPYCSTHVIPLGRHREVSRGMSLMVPSPHSSRAGDQGLIRSSGDQYDPLFDSIEPSATSLKKTAHQRDDGADNSDIMLRLSDARQVLDVEENKSKNTEFGADATSEGNDGFGETDEGEIGPVESDTPSDNDEGKPAAETETNHVKKERKSKKSKDSRSMKLFKAELACFVKEVLKPSWRQGNMSKEAFKTIVKKTVEKVSGALKGRPTPKSKAKINQYIASSHRKLTRLVEGYVNKYAKA